jgi:hypothetical protein
MGGTVTQQGKVILAIRFDQVCEIKVIGPKNLNIVYTSGPVNHALPNADDDFALRIAGEFAKWVQSDRTQPKPS